MSISQNDTFALMKTLLDAHTMGVHAASALLRDCGYRVLVSPPEIEDALDRISSEEMQDKIVSWIKENNITRIGFSYRLDPDNAVNIFGRLVYLLKKEGLYDGPNSQVTNIHFAGLKPACEYIEKEYSGKIKTFKGGESAEETLIVMGIPEKDIPQTITDGCKYDKELLQFGRKIINDAEYEGLQPFNRIIYPEFGTYNDRLIWRLERNFVGGFQPLIRAHLGPYSSGVSREQCLKEYNNWCKELAKSGFLDILSVGSSQLSQSNFGEDWGNKLNGGGVPVNSKKEYRDIWEAARPMLVRTYSGTKNVESMAEVYEETINIAWHALSLWWFDELDGRGPNSLYANLKEHISAMQYISKIGKPVETNVPHHFAFRGCDDITYIVSGYLAAKMAKICGVNFFVLQNMLNTPRSTWGIQDLAKSRVLIKLVNELQDNSFRVILQTRAGLDYFKPDLEEAKVQLAAVAAKMDDIDPYNHFSPEIIHVVSYCEALFLATPDILNDSIKITRHALNEYRKYKKNGMTPNVMTDDIKKRTNELEISVRNIIKAMEENIPNLYSAEGLYVAFVAGWLPVPELWSDSDEFICAKKWETKMSNGGVHLIEHGLLVSTDTKINRCVSNIPEAQYQLKCRYLQKESIVQ